MAFRKKAEFLLRHKPDIVIVPECEHPDKLIFNDETPKPNDFLWYGTNQNKGLGIFSYTGFQLKQLENYDPELKMIIPISVSRKKIKFTLFAIWANNPSDPDGQYITQIWKALKHYKEQMDYLPK